MKRKREVNKGMGKFIGSNVVMMWAVSVCLAPFVLASASVERSELDWDIFSHGRTKREVFCEKRYKTVTSGHTRCRQPSPRAKDLGGVSEEDQRLIVDIHNRVRGEVSPPATGMLNMSWDPSLAVTATRWAFYCLQKHDDKYKRYEYGRFSVGQNLAWASYDMGWERAIGLWADEKKDFTYNGNNNLAAVGHYTQMVWATTVRLGCGLALCGDTYYYVCNYGPAGNLDINKPYSAGPACDDCPGRCRNYLCDCGDRVCLNGGTMNLNNCTCTCSKSFHIQPDCGLNCTDIEMKEPRYCNEQYRPSSCDVYSNVPQECPSMCRWCPDADYRIINSPADNNPSSSSKMICSLLPCYIVWSLFTILACLG